MQVIQMTPKEWAQVKDNPIQRDTEDHAKKALRSHLRTPSPTHRVVHAAKTLDGELYKLDGHTRSFLWSNGQLKAPEILTVIIYEVNDIEEATVRYQEFDSQAATENSRDKITGAYRLHEIESNGVFKDGGVTSALKLISDSKDIYKIVGEWKNEITLINRLQLSKKVLPTGLLAAALLCARKHGEKSLEFWQLFSEGAGTRIDGKSDGVDELHRLISVKRAAGQLSCSHAQKKDLAEKALSCFENWLEGKRYSQGAKGTDIKKYIASIQTKKRGEA